jgi:hypothetical protein
VITGSASVTVAPQAYGQNYWAWITAWGDPVANVQTAAEAMKINVLRAGGDNNDTNSPQVFDETQIDAFVAYAKAIGAEPILQVPVETDINGNTPGTAAAAAQIVTYANITQGYGIKYWEIGNEPDLYASAGPFVDAGYTVDDYATTFLSFAAAMKAVDPTIQILGPELSWKYIPGNDWLSPFLDQCAGAVDIVSVHRYPFDDAQCTLAAAMGDSASFAATVTALRNTMSAHDAGAKPLAITEGNLSYQGTSAAEPAALGTFYAGMWVADTLGIALEQQLWTMAYWSLEEGDATGFFVNGTTTPRPAVYAYELLSTHFGPTILHASTVPTGFSAHASRDDAAQKTVVLVINRTAQDADQLISFEGLSVTPANQLIQTPAYSLTLIEVPDNGTTTELQYTMAMAAQSLGPQPVNPQP